MPSPFPGMDPYLEGRRWWLDFHNTLAGQIRMALNLVLGPRYLALTTSDVAYEMIAIETPVRLFAVEIRTVDEDELVTAIEILSPSNKRSRHDDGLAYRKKRRKLLCSDVNLIEIDLLRAGDRPPLVEPVPDAPYYVVVSRANRRPVVDVWPIQLDDPLPTIPVPLRHPDPEVPLDLGAVVTTVYDGGPYSRRIDYRQPPPPPPLTDEQAAWLEEHLRDLRSP